MSEHGFTPRPHDGPGVAPLDDALVERLLAGATVPDELPDEYRAVSRFLATLAEEPPVQSADLMMRTTAQMVEAVEAVDGVVALDAPMPRPRRRATTSRVALVAAIVVALAGLTGGLAAADALPRPLQRTVAKMFDAVGVQVPTPDAPGPDAPGPDVPSGPSGSHIGPGVPRRDTASAKAGASPNGRTQPAPGTTATPPPTTTATTPEVPTSAAPPPDAATPPPADGSGGGNGNGAGNANAGGNGNGAGNANAGGNGNGGAHGNGTANGNDKGNGADHGKPAKS